MGKGNFPLSGRRRRLQIVFMSDNAQTSRNANLPHVVGPARYDCDIEK